MAKSKKRLLLRLLVVSVIVGLGVAAIIMAQRGMQKKAQAQQQTPNSKTDEPLQGKSPQPIPIVPDEPGKSPGGGAFDAGQFSPPSNQQQPSTSLPPLRQGGQFQENSIPPIPAAPKSPPAQGPTTITPPTGSYGGGVNASLGDGDTKQQNALPQIPPAQNSQQQNTLQQPPVQPIAPLRPADNCDKGGYDDPPPNLQQSPPPAKRFDGGGFPSAEQNIRQLPTDNSLPNNISPITPRQSAPVQAFPLRNNTLPGGDDQTASDTPGAKALEGTQSPSLALEKRAPAEIQVGKPALFQTVVKNIGRTEAQGVTVIDRIPRGTKFVDATPQAEQTADGSLIWNLGAMKPGEETTISLQLMPTTEGEIGSVARVVFEAAASVRTVCTKPQLTIRHSCPPRVLIGQNVTFDIEISNPGSGAASGVMIEEDVPVGLAHAAGKELEFEIGVLRPGESRKLQLTLKADKAGKIQNALVVRGDGNLIAEHRTDLEIIAPKLQVAMSGPTLRYLQREATYRVSVANPGTAPAKEIELVAHLPKGMKYLSANNNGQYDPQNHAVYWSLEELPPTVAGDVELKTMPIEAGQQQILIKGRAQLGLAAEDQQQVTVEALADLYFEVADTADPIEVGKDTEYRVRVTNRGTKTANNVQIAALVPDGMQAVGGDGPTRAGVNGREVVFQPLARLAPNGEAVFKIQARGLKAGDQRIQVQMASDETRVAVIKEESTRIYSDR